MTMLNREVLKQQKVLKLLSSVSLRLIPYLAGNTDLDGRINVTKEQIEEANIMTPRLINEALNKLESVGLIHKDADGYLYSNLNTISKADNHSFHYINIYNFFQSSEFKKTYKRQLLFLYYILTAKLPGTEHSVALEHLYQNRSNAKNVKLSFFISFEDMMNNLLELIEKGLFEVRLGNSSEVINKDTKTIKDRLYTFAGKKGKRKQRISHKEEKHKIIHIRISKDLVTKDKICDIYDMTRLSTLQDLKSIAKEYGCSLDSFDVKVLEKVHMVKAKIYKEFGNVGIQLYRDSLKEFFSNRSHAFQYLMENGEFANTIKNYYVIPRVEEKIRAFFDQVTNEYVNEVNTLPYQSLNLKHALKDSKSLVSYITEESFNDNLILLDREFEAANSFIYEQITQLDKTWYEFKEKVEKIFRDEAETHGNSRNKVVYLAIQKKLSQKERDTVSKANQNNKSHRELLLYNPYKTISY
ncbi:hypothetical protein [Ornithinibacillus californiensis]|uniref:hypothetical protein n=1 Tax=Ornithinibacillus californiensis TaxID=161536 RepID=UPI00064DDD46|nr:hypothetical protein [Ornithinibacillus californiensis]